MEKALGTRHEALGDIDAAAINDFMDKIFKSSARDQVPASSRLENGVRNFYRKDGTWCGAMNEEAYQKLIVTSGEVNGGN